MTPQAEIEAALEAILFASSEPVPRARLVEVFDEEDRAQVEAALETVLARFPNAEGRGIQVEEVAGGVRLVTRPELAGWLRRFFDVRASGKLSMAALETLAIIAYRQSITAPEIQELRGVSSSGVLKTLLERRLIKIAGRKAVVGSPFLYRTTREFLVHFGLGSLKDLPPLEEMEESFGEAGESLGERRAQLAEGPVAEGEAMPALPAAPDREESILRQLAEIEDQESEEAAAADDDAETAATAAFEFEVEGS